MSRAFCPECGNGQPEAGVCVDGCDAFALVCPKCDGDGYIETCRADGDDCRQMACECRAGGEWEDRQQSRDEDYERAVARARANDFADTDGRDWT